MGTTGGDKGPGWAGGGGGGGGRGGRESLTTQRTVKLACTFGGAKPCIYSHAR